MLFLNLQIWNSVYVMAYLTGANIKMAGTLYVLTVFAAFSNCVVNPFIYCIQYKPFQKQALALVKGKSARPTQSTVVTLNWNGNYPFYDSYSSSQVYTAKTLQGEIRPPLKRKTPRNHQQNNAPWTKCRFVLAVHVWSFACFLTSCHSRTQLRPPDRMWQKNSI